MNRDLYGKQFDEMGTKIVEIKESVSDCDDELYELYTSMTDFQIAKSKNVELLRADRQSIREKRKRIFWINRFLRILEKRVNRVITLYTENKKVTPRELRKCIHTMSLFEKYFQYETEDEECYIKLTDELFKTILGTLKSFIISYKQEKELLNGQIGKLSESVNEKVRFNAECDRNISKCRRNMRSIENKDNKAKRKIFKLKRGVNSLNNKFINESTNKKG